MHKWKVTPQNAKMESAGALSCDGGVADGHAEIHRSPRVILPNLVVLVQTVIKKDPHEKYDLFPPTLQFTQGHRNRHVSIRHL